MTTGTVSRDATEAFITPGVLTWARERLGLSLPAAAKKFGVIPTTLEAWESGGENRPTLRKAAVIAQKLQIPLGYLFLSEPPELQVTLPDLRTINGTPPRNISPEFYDTICDSFRKQEWYREHLGDLAETLPFVGRFTLSSPSREIAADLNETMELSTALRRRSDKWEEFLKGFIKKTEEVGIIVLRSSIVGNNTSRHLDRNEFRGFVISDSIAPLIFLNGRDWKSAQIFTLAHELAHLWIGQSGISNPDYGLLPEEQPHVIEKLCNTVATEALLPDVDFLSGWNNAHPTSKNVQFLTRYFKVSRVVILRRALELKKISRHEFAAEYATIYGGSDGDGTSASSGSGGSFYENLVGRNSNTFTNAVVGAVLNGDLLDRDAANLLNVKVPTLNRFIEFVTGEA